MYYNIIVTYKNHLQLIVFIILSENNRETTISTGGNNCFQGREQPFPEQEIVIFIFSLLEIVVLKGLLGGSNHFLIIFFAKMKKSLFTR